MNKLFKVEITRVLLVYSEDETTAKRLAFQNEGKDLDNYPDDLFVDEVKDLKEVPQSWIRSIPFNEDPYMALTVEDLLEDEPKIA